jgi:hypothetical protein
MSQSSFPIEVVIAQIGVLAEESIRLLLYMSEIERIIISIVHDHGIVHFRSRVFQYCVVPMMREIIRS